MDSKQDDAGLFDRNPTLNRYLPEVLIQSQQDTSFRFGEIQQFDIRPSRAIGSRPTHIVATGTQQFHNRLWEVLISQEMHLS
jgi:prophage tail gpP-like protein